MTAGRSVGLVLAAALIGCAPVRDGDDDDSCAADTATLTELVTETFDSSCAFGSCHGSPSFEADLDLSSAEGACAAVDPGNPDGSPLFAAVTDQHSGVELEACEADRIRLWIERGADCD